MIPSSERDDVRTPWGWLRGFAWFLLLWPLLGLLALGELRDYDWDSILLALLGPAAIGLVLLLLERGLTRWFGTATAVAGQPVPSLLRDGSNLALTLLVLMGINVVLVLTFEERNIFAREDMEAGAVATSLLVGLTAATVVLRVLHRVVKGPWRNEDLGEGWDDAPMMLRFLGYLVLIPMVLVCTVMLDYTLRGKPDFGTTGWVVLPAILWLGLRSAMARSPRYWARNPWEAWLRAQSLALPWWIVGVVIGVGTCVLLMVAPFALSEDEISFAGRIIVGVLLGPIGAFGIFIAIITLGREIPQLLRRGRAAWRLSREPTALLGWELRASSSPRSRAGAKPGAEEGARPLEVRLRLRGGREVSFDVPAEDAPLVRWLRAHA